MMWAGEVTTPTTALIVILHEKCVVFIHNIPYLCVVSVGKTTGWLSCPTHRLVMNMNWTTNFQI